MAYDPGLPAATVTGLEAWEPPRGLFLLALFSPLFYNVSIPSTWFLSRLSVPHLLDPLLVLQADEVRRGSRQL